MVKGCPGPNNHACVQRFPCNQNPVCPYLLQLPWARQCPVHQPPAFALLLAELLPLPLPGFPAWLGGLQVDQDWIAPMFPVIYPEECKPGSWQEVQPACDRATRWLTEAPPEAVNDIRKRRSFCIQVRRARVLHRHRMMWWWWRGWSVEVVSLLQARR